LKGNNVDVLISEKIEGGVEWMKEIERNIGEADCSLLILTEKSLESKWVPYEVGLTRSDRKRVIPYIPDFLTLEVEKIPEFIKRFQIIGLEKDEDKKREKLLRSIEEAVSKRTFSSSFINFVAKANSEDSSEARAVIKLRDRRYKNLDLSNSESPQIILENVDALRVDASDSKVEKIIIKNSRIMVLDMSSSRIGKIELCDSAVGILDLSASEGLIKGERIALKRKNTEIIHIDLHRAFFKEVEEVD